MVPVYHVLCDVPGEFTVHSPTSSPSGLCLLFLCLEELYTCSPVLFFSWRLITWGGLLPWKTDTHTHCSTHFC